MNIRDLDIPDMYKSLLRRVEEIEQLLSRTMLNTTSKMRHVGEHAEEEKAKEVNVEELITDKIVPITLSSKSYLKIAIHAKKYANLAIKKKYWVEVIGILTGRMVNENTPIEKIAVNDAWSVGHGDAVSVQIMETASITKIIDKLPDGDFIVGWYHSHPSYGNFLSIDDYNTQNRYQALWSRAIALVIDPTQITKSEYGFGVFRNNKKGPSSKGYTELKSEVDGLQPSAAHEILQLIRPAFEKDDLSFLDYE